MIVLLDSGPLGLLTNPKNSELSLECGVWVDSLWSKGYKVVIATTNVGHLSRFVDARQWQEIS